MSSSLSLLNKLIVKNSHRKDVVRILIGDPSYFKSRKDFLETISFNNQHAPSSSMSASCSSTFSSSFSAKKLPSMYVSVLITQSLWDAISVNSKKFLRSSIEDPDEQYYDFAIPQDRNFIIPPSHSSYSYIGSHMTDSRLTSIIRADVYDDPKTEDQINVDWTEFVYYTLYGSEEIQQNPDDFPIFKFYGRIPDESSMAMAVFGIPQDQNERIDDLKDELKMTMVRDDNGKGERVKEQIYKRLILRPFDFVEKD